MKYVTLDIEFNGVPVTAIKYTEGPFKDIIYCYYGVRFEEQTDQLVLHFEYEIIEGSITDTSAFIQAAGDTLVEIIEEKNAKREPLIYTGGIDEVGTEDS